MTEEQFKKLENLIETNGRTMGEKIDKVKEEILKTINKELKNCKAKIEDTARRTDDNERLIDDVIDNAKKITNLRLVGIPHAANESCDDILMKLSALLGYQNKPEAIIFRVKYADKSTGPIIIRFPSEMSKLFFYERYIKIASKLTIGQLLGSHSSTTKPSEAFFITHDLCKAQYEVNKLARTLLKDGTIKKFKIAQGFVMIKLSDSEPFKRFNSTSQLTDAITNKKKKWA